MRILVLSSLAFSLTNFRGALLAEMRRNGHEVTAVAPDHDETVERALAALGIPLVVVPMNRTGTRPVEDLATLARYVRLMRKVEPDVVLAYTQKPIIYGGLAARIHGKARFFALMSGLGYLFSEDASQRVLLAQVFRRLYREGVRRAEKIFVFNSDDHRDMLEAGIVSPAQDVQQVPGSGVDIAHFAHQPLPAGPPSFLMVSRLMRDKGVYDFVEAARLVRARHPGASFRLLGRPEPSNATGIDAAEAERLARDYPVEFLPETRDVRPCLAAASVFVLPTCYREGLPRTILEAMATGRPIITTDRPGCRDAVEPEGNGLLVPPRSPEQLAAAMCRLIEEPGLLQAMASRSRAMAEQTYDVHRVNRTLMTAMDLYPQGSAGQRLAAPANRASEGSAAKPAQMVVPA